MCLIAMRDPDDIKKQNQITIKLSMNVIDFCASKLDKAKKNLIVFDDCCSDRDQVIQNNFFQNGRHGKCACIYLTHRFHHQNKPESNTRKYWYFCFIQTT